jgi:hypothetical protein
VYVILALTYANPALASPNFPKGEMAIGETPSTENLEEFWKTERPSLNFVRAGVAWLAAGLNLVRFSLTNVLGTEKDMVFV